MNKKNNRLEKSNKKPYYGWIIVAVSALILFFSGPGQTYSISIFIDYYVETFAWGRTQISSYYSMATLAAGFTLPIMGNAIDKKGQRKMLVLISFALGMSALWMSFVKTPLMLIIGFFFLRLFGQGSMILLPNTLVPKWFQRNRGKALSLMGLGLVISSATVPLLNNFLLVNLGAAIAWRTWTVLLLLVMIPIGYLLVRDKPEDMGLKADGDKDTDIEENRFKATKKIEVSIYPWNLKEAMKTRVFWQLLVCNVIPPMINTGITFHIVSIISEKGLSSAFAASILGLMALSQFPMVFIAGFVVDKVKTHYVKGLSFILYFLVIVVLYFGESPAMLILYALLQGIFMAFDSVSTGVIWPNYFGSVNLGSIRGIAMTAVVVGSALGPMPFGIAYDIFGSYNQILVLMMIFPVIGALLSFASPAPKEPIKLFL